MRGVVAVFAASVVLAGCPESAEEHVRKAHVFFSNGDLASAEKEYRRALEISPALEVPHEGLGNVAFERGELARAEEWYRKAIEVAPRAVNARHRLAITLAERGEVKPAIAVLEAALEIDAKNAFALHALGGLYQRAGDLARAEKMQIAAINVDPKHKGARFALAGLFVDASRFEEAERELTKLEADGARALAEYGYARLEAKRGRFAEAAKRLERVLELGVTHPKKVLADDAFEKSWTDPAMQPLRTKLEALKTKTSTAS